MRTPARYLAVFCLWFAFASSAFAADGRILDFEGDVRVNGAPVSSGTTLLSADTIATGSDGWVTIVLADNSVLELDSDATVTLEEYSFNPDSPEDNKSDINVVEGTLRYVSGLIAKDNPDNIEFTAGGSTIGVRGSYTTIEVQDAVVVVKAVVGEAVVQFEDDDCPEKIYIVATGTTAETNPVTCEAIIETTTERSKVDALILAIAEGEDITEALAELSESEQSLVIAVIINNAETLNVTESMITDIVNSLPGNTPPVVIADVLLNDAPLGPDDSDRPPPSDEVPDDGEEPDVPPQDPTEPVLPPPTDPPGGFPPGSPPSLE
ncbi:MAG: FecR domain-containing protein [Pseudomonadota bacterium]